MSWFKVDDMFWSHPKVIALSASATGLWVRAGSWAAAYLTDGRIPRHVVYMLIPEPKRKVDECISELIAAGLWAATDDGWLFHDWADMQPSREHVLARRADDASRKRRGRDTQRHLRSVDHEG